MARNCREVLSKHQENCLKGMKNKTLGENRTFTIPSFLINITSCLPNLVFTTHFTCSRYFFLKHDSFNIWGVRFGMEKNTKNGQVIQFVPSSSPDRWRSPTILEFGSHMNSASQKGHKSRIARLQRFFLNRHETPAIFKEKILKELFLVATICVLTSGSEWCLQSVGLKR